MLFYPQGDVIHASICKNLIDNYKTQINESSVYVFSNFKVQESQKYRPVCNDLKITFMYNTKVKQVKESAESFPEYYFDFASIDTLQKRANKDQHLSGKFYCFLSLFENIILLLVDFKSFKCCRRHWTTNPNETN